MKIERRRTKLIGLFLLVLAAATISKADDLKNKRDEGIQRLQKAATALNNLTSMPDKGIPQEVIDGAKCIAVVPNLTKGGFIFGAMRGRGVATCKLPDRGWSTPAFFTLSGGSWGAQIGVEDVHLVIMVVNDQGMRDPLNNKFQIGASASASAGPVGRHASAGTDWKADTEMLTYSRSKGLFAGIDLGASWIEHDKDVDQAFYGRDVTNMELLTGKLPPPQEARAFLDEVSNVKAVARAEQ
jgi:lipid-binding SYLF domain-containing protein